MRPVPWLAVLAALAACATPQERCISEATRDIKVVDHLIARDRATLDRGYALAVETWVHPRLQFCQGLVSFDGYVGIGTSTCIEPRSESRVVAEAVDLDVVARRLASLERKRVELADRTETGIASCRATYPPV
jgi:hypothetical protein